MLVRRHGKGYHFVGDPASGVTLRWGATPNQDPVRAPWPELADISISNRCPRGCAFCYRDSTPDGDLMSFEAYVFALDRLNSPRWGNVFQVALGGGEPALHPDFVRILRHTRQKGVTPNFTTSGLGLDKTLARHAGALAGAAAVSTHSLDALDRRALALLTQAGTRVNVHFVLSASSLAEATDILLGRRDQDLEGVSAVIFLTFKPMGRASSRDCLRDGPELARFLAAVDDKRCRVDVGFDACFVPLLLRHTGVNPDCVDICEGGFFSVFIDEALHARPCSFAPPGRHDWSLERFDMEFIWNRAFESHRSGLEAPACALDCPVSAVCRGPCPFHPEATPCPVEGKDH